MCAIISADAIAQTAKKAARPSPQKIARTMVVVTKELFALSADLCPLLGGVSIETGDFETCSMECS